MDEGRYYEWGRGRGYKKYPESLSGILTAEERGQLLRQPETDVADMGRRCLQRRAVSGACGQHRCAVQQRVAIARALANKPKIILADEPTGNLDTNTGNDVLKILLDGVHEYGQTLIMITHDPDIANYADRVVRIENGMIVE